MGDVFGIGEGCGDDGGEPLLDVQVNKRPNWEEYFLLLAKVASTRATCLRAQHGAVIVRDHIVLATGYNGALAGLPHCTEVGCHVENSHCVSCEHAERNAIFSAARHGVRLEGADIYVTGTPCWPCFRAIAAAGIKRIFYGSLYRLDARVTQAAEKLGIAFVQVGHAPEEPGIAFVQGEQS
jgi:dCMP deaminase